jgi:hypothetical protein
LLFVTAELPEQMDQTINLALRVVEQSKQIADAIKDLVCLFRWLRLDQQG